MAGKKLEFSTRLTREDVAGVIEALIEGLKDGHLRVQKSDEVLHMAVPRVVDLEIEAEIDDERAEFEIEVSWRTNRAENPDNPPEDTAPGQAEKGAGAGKKKAAPAKKPGTAKNATGIGKTDAAKKVAPAKTTASAKKTVTDKAATPAKKAASAKKAEAK